MARSVVLNGGPRCERCQIGHRWCICDGFRAVELPLLVDVLMHHHETLRPTSTGHLINRVVPASGHHIYRPERAIDREAIARPGKTLWILHPLGEPLPSGPVPTDLQVLLIDGSWVQSAAMMREVDGWGQRVSLPMTGASRYWLRAQQGDGMFSTVEALLFLLAALGLNAEHAALQLQFELRVYAGLCARGKKADAAKFLVDSPVREAFPELLKKLAPRDRERDREREV